MKKKIIISAIIIAAIAGTGFAATRAFFNARVRSTNSSFTVGTLDLSVDGKQEDVDNIVVAGIGESGNITGGKTWTIKNIGTLPGKLYFKLDQLNNVENGCNRAEKATETTCENDTVGELGNVLSTTILVNDSEIVTSKLGNTNQEDYATAWNTKPAVIIPAGGEATVTMNWNTTANDYGNEIQSDSLTFDTIFDLVQITE
jgi:hypothetical protein